MLLCQRGAARDMEATFLCPAAMQQTELVAMLRSRARKSGTQTSHYRGVSLLKQTQKWHAQINVGGRQVNIPLKGAAAKCRLTYMYSYSVKAADCRLDEALNIKLRVLRPVTCHSGSSGIFCNRGAGCTSLRQGSN